MLYILIAGVPGHDMIQGMCRGHKLNEMGIWCKWGARTCAGYKLNKVVYEAGVGQGHGLIVPDG